MLDFCVDSLSVWEKLQKTTEPIVMYGTGNGADKVMDILESLGITLSGITASNGFVRERTFRGFPVKPLEYFEEIYSDFTVIISFGTSQTDVMENIYNISKKHSVLVPCVPVIGTEIFDRRFLEKYEKEINLAYSLMADELSKKIFSGYVNFQFGGDIRILKEIETPEEEAYKNILKLNTTETFVDIGAYRGDTIEKFLSYTKGEYDHIVAAEPDKKTFSKLLANCGHLHRFKALNVAVTDTDGQTGFSSLAGRQSQIGGSSIINCLSLSTLCEGIAPTFIKIDSEGCEWDILNGGEDIIKKFKPKLNVAAYHKSEDIFKLPILLKSLNSQYKIHLRHHPYIPAWDTIFYCV